MALLNTIFAKDHSANLIEELGNIIVSGVETPGAKRLYEDILADGAAKGHTMILVNGSLDVRARGELCRKVTSICGPGRAWEFTYTADSARVDILSAYETAEEKADFILRYLRAGGTMITDAHSEQMRLFYTCAILARMADGMPCRLADLLLLTVDEVISLVKGCSLSAFEKAMYLPILEDANMYRTFATAIAPAVIKAKNGGLWHEFSGNRPMSDVLRPGNVVMLSGLATEDAVKRTLLLVLFLDAIGKCVQKCLPDESVLFLMQDAEGISPEYTLNLLRLNRSYQFATYFFVQDILRFLEKNGSEVLEASDAYAVFRQSSTESASFWSQAFGSAEINEASYSYVPRRSLLDLFGMPGAGGLLPRINRGRMTISVQKTYKPFYLPSVFQNLRPSEVMVLCKNGDRLYRRKMIM